MTKTPYRGRVLVMLAEDEALQSLRWAMAGPDRRLLARGRLGEDASPLPDRPERIVLIVPGQPIVTRRLDDAGPNNPVQARAAALHRMAQDMAEPETALSGSVSAPDAEGRRLAAVVRSATLAAWLERAAGLGVVPDVVLPDSLIAPPPDGDGWTALPLFERVVMRGRDAAFTAEPDLAEAIASGQTVTVLDDPDQLTDLVIAAAFEPSLNLMDGLTGAKAHSWRSWRRAAVLAAILALFPLIFPAAEALRFEIAARTLDQRSREAALAAWPDIAPDADPSAEARRRLGPGFSSLAAALFAAVEPVEGAELETLTRDENGDARAAVAYGDPADLGRINAALAEHGFRLDEEGVQEENGRMISDVAVAFSGTVSR